MKRKFEFIINDGVYTKAVIEVKYKKNEKGQKVFSASGHLYEEVYDNCVSRGQCLDKIKEVLPDNELFNEIYRLWKLYHLNDMHAECEHQRELGWKELANEELIIYHWALKRCVLDKVRDLERESMKELKQHGKVQISDADRDLLNLKYEITTESEELSDELKEHYEPLRSVVGDKHKEIQYAGWLTEKQHSKGVLGKKCPVCGYKYGSSWNYMPVPEDDEKIIYDILQDMTKGIPTIKIARESMWNHMLLAKFVDGTRLKVGGKDREDCIHKVAGLEEEHGNYVWAVGYNDEKYECGERIWELDFAKYEDEES